jgi:hypothetical protein
LFVASNSNIRPATTTLTVKVLDFEDVSTSLRGNTNNLGSVDLHKALLLKELAEEFAYTSLNAEDGLVGDGLQK